MPAIYQKIIKREDLTRNPDVLYLFGDNDLRVGLGGQAGQMRGEPNAVGVRTKWAPGMHEEDFFCDLEFPKVVSMMEEDLKVAQSYADNGGVVVIPTDGLGTGLSQLPIRAPKIYEWLISRLQNLG